MNYQSLTAFYVNLESPLIRLKSDYQTDLYNIRSLMPEDSAKYGPEPSNSLSVAQPKSKKVPISNDNWADFSAPISSAPKVNQDLMQMNNSFEAQSLSSQASIKPIRTSVSEVPKIEVYNSAGNSASLPVEDNPW